MAQRIFLVVAAIVVLGTLGFSFGETGRPFGQAIVIAAQPTATVELYVTEWCPYCRQAIKFFKDRGIPYTAYDIEKDSEAAKRKEKLSPRSGVPLAVINGKKIYGFSEQIYSQVLGIK